MAPTTAARRAAAAGPLAVAVGLGVAELAAGLLDGGRSLVIAVGDEVIDRVPGWLERAIIGWLGTADKPFLLVNIVLICLALGAGIGVLARRRPLAGAAAMAALFAVGTAAAFADPQAEGAGPALTGAAGALAAIAALAVLVRAAGGGQPAPASPGPPLMTAVDRRRFLGLAGAAAAVAGLTAAGGRWLVADDRLDAVRRAIRLPRPARRAPPVPGGAELGIPGLSPVHMPNGRFYRIDTALRVPRVDPAEWTLEVRGRVDRPFRITYDELMAMPHLEAEVTLACVSNEVGGELVGNARWQGVPIRRLLERAGVQQGATQIVGRSVDGFTAGFPTQRALDDEHAMVAIAMNGELLPLRHGFPARLVVPGLYGYVSATKWLAAIELATWEEFDGFWIPRGWSKEGPIKTQSRIDVPRPGSLVAAGRTPIAGVAWAPTRGIRRVEVRIDDGSWQEARLASSLGDEAWRQWVLPWEATPGRHVIAVRATDGEDAVQTDELRPPPPDGATGLHTIRVEVA